MKKLILLFAAIFAFCFSGVSFAAIERHFSVPADTALFIQIDPNGVGKPQETEQEICKDIQAKLKDLNHVIVDTEKTQQDLRIYIRENADTVTQRGTDEGVILKSADFQALGAMENVPYVVLVSSRITAAETKSNFWTGARKNLTVLTEVVVYDVENQKYLMADEFTTVGSTSGSNDRAYSRAIKEMLEQVNFNY